MTFDRNGEEERFFPLWVKEAAIKAIPLVLAGAVLYVFLKYGALIALMAIFSGVMVFYVAGIMAKWLRKLGRKDRGDDSV